MARADRVAQHRGLEALGGDRREYGAKGSKPYVEGKIQTSSWEDRQSGERKYRNLQTLREIVVALEAAAQGNTMKQ
jgi:single-stranded DNA-binding protein